MSEAPQQPNNRDFKIFAKYSTPNDSSGLFAGLQKFSQAS